MMVELNMEEATIFKEALTGEISELGMEISDTDQKDFRNNLKRRKEILREIVEKLQKIAA